MGMIQKLLRTQKEPDENLLFLARQEILYEKRQVKIKKKHPSSKSSKTRSCLGKATPRIPSANRRYFLHSG